MHEQRIMMYFKIVDEGEHTTDWGGDPTYWLEVNEQGHAERQIERYPNGNVVSYDRTHEQDDYGALGVMVVDGDEGFWASYAISKDEFEQEWRTHLPLNTRPLDHT
jgi:hypothetical protein